MAQNAATAAIYGMPMPQFINIHWEANGKVETLRFWGYARTIQDPISAMVERVDIELRQEAIFAIPRGAETDKALKKQHRKRKREEAAKQKADDRRATRLMRRMAEATVAEVREEERVRREEERARRAEENAEEVRQLREAEDRLLAGERVDEESRA